MEAAKAKVCEKWNGLSELQKMLVVAIAAVILTLIVLSWFADASYEGLSAVGGAAKVTRNLRLVNQDL